MKYSRGWKYRVEEDTVFRLQTNITIRATFEHECWRLDKDHRVLLLRNGYCWNGADLFPDFPWVKAPSAGHDALLQAIVVGVIPEAENDLVDKEFSLWIAGSPGTRALFALRSWYCRLGTNLAHTPFGEKRKVYDTPPLPNELRLADFQLIT